MIMGLESSGVTGQYQNQVVTRNQGQRPWEMGSIEETEARQETEMSRIRKFWRVNCEMEGCCNFAYHIFSVSKRRLANRFRYIKAYAILYFLITLKVSGKSDVSTNARCARTEKELVVSNLKYIPEGRTCSKNRSLVAFFQKWCFQIGHTSKSWLIEEVKKT